MADARHTPADTHRRTDQIRLTHEGRQDERVYFFFRKERLLQRLVGLPESTVHRCRRWETSSLYARVRTLPPTARCLPGHFSHPLRRRSQQVVCQVRVAHTSACCHSVVALDTSLLNTYKTAATAATDAEFGICPRIHGKLAASHVA